MTEESVSLRVIIVDDEDLARAVLREHLAAHPYIEVVGECANGFQAVKAVSELKPDLIFLDIQMPKLNGFEVLELLPDPPAVIFVTAFDQYAVKAFDVHAIDYLMKPFSAERLKESLEHALEHVGQQSKDAVAALLAETKQREAPIERILVRDGARVHVVPVDKLDFVEAQDDYVCLHAEGKRYLKEQTMAELETLLDPKRFVRIHRSYILNIERIARVELYAKDSRIAILQNGTKMPVSRSGYARLSELL
jgi:two-component system, LytTR family, response regulator